MENLDGSIKRKIECSQIHCSEWKLVLMQTKCDDLLDATLGNSLDKLNKVNVSSLMMDTIRHRIGNVLECITDRKDSDKNHFDFLTFVNMFSLMRYICAYFTKEDDCDLHFSNQIDKKEKTRFVNFFKDCLKWLNTIDHVRQSKGYRYSLERNLKDILNHPEKYFDADIYNRYIKDSLMMKDAFRSENKARLVTEICSILRNMCRQQTCKCDSIKTLPFIFYFAHLQCLLHYMS